MLSLCITFADAQSRSEFLLHEQWTHRSLSVRLLQEYRIKFESREI
ncbi:unnamed protein product [Moneuplotes crassus]|uniref:Uncharacterized protein n=1 Tax=Euplotes crassus TaxID=5936 RepID=A0AAD1X8M1_EUPCR|nr:unnamed protein product [Moneuplotes crassus]